MNSNNFGLTLFDILSYLVPGYILLVGLSIIESTYTDYSLLCFSSITDNWIAFSFIAYFLGHFCYSIFTIITSIMYSILKKYKYEDTGDLSIAKKNKIILKTYRFFFPSSTNYLSEPLSRLISKNIRNTYHLNANEIDKISKMEKYLLADSYVISSGGSDERTSLLVREGFYQSSTIAFFIITLICFTSLFEGGINIQINLNNIQELGLNYSLWVTIFTGLITIIFGLRRKFFHRMKINNTYVLFLAYKEKNSEKNDFA